MNVVPLRRGGWWHDYVCPTHAVELNPAVDGVYPCRYGCELTGEPYAAAWLVFQHQGAAREARRRAHGFRHTGSPEDRGAAVDILDAYATLYHEVSRSGWNQSSEGWMLRGKLFAQALTEAQWAAQIADTVIALHSRADRDGGLDRPVVEMLRGLLETITAARTILVDQRDDERNNYTAWLNAAGRLLDLALQACGEPADPQPWTERAYAHLRLAIGEDGWEWEGSTYYHLFVLRAYLLGLKGGDPAELPADITERIAAMVRVLAELAAPDGRLPALHDGPYDRTGLHQEVLEVAALAAQLLQPTGLDTVQAWARRRLGDVHDQLEDLLTGWFSGEPVATRPATRASVLFPTVGYAVLRDPEDRFQVVLDAGPHGGSHGHFDKLALYLYGQSPWQPAPGVPPYASPLRRGYYARTSAHPTVRIDGRDQCEATAVIESWDSDGRRVVASTEQAVPGVTLRRELVLTDGQLVDIMTVTASDGGDHDITLALRPAGGLALRTTGQATHSVWSGETGVDLVGFHQASTTSDLTLRPGRGPSDDPSVVLPVADWQARGRQVSFVSVFSFDEASHPEKVEVHFDELGSPTVHLHLRHHDTITIEATR